VNALQVRARGCGRSYAQAQHIINSTIQTTKMSKGQATEHVYETHGATCSPEEVKEFIKEMYVLNIERRKKNKYATPTNIQGQMGIAKTAIVELATKELSAELSYEVGFKSIPLGQTEEAGDITGMPTRAVTMIKSTQEGYGNIVTVKRALVITDAVQSYIHAGWQVDESVPAITINLPPSWIPIKGVDPDHGILLMDDFTRAPRNILQAIMQVLQEYKLNSSWSIMEGWDIVLTSNPSGGDYNVEELDPAQVTRMRHIGMKFEAKDWAKWAEEEGLDSRGINFVLAHPEIVGADNRTCPRTLESLFVMTKDIRDLKASLPKVILYAKSCIGPDAVSMFATYISKEMVDMPSSEDILNDDFEKTKRSISKFVGTNGTAVQQDVMFIICLRLENYIKSNISTSKIEFTKEMQDNLEKFLLIENFPADVRYALIQDIMHWEGNTYKIFKNFLGKRKNLARFTINV